ALHPEQGDHLWRTLVQNSFRTGILSSETAYLVVENKAQEQALLDKQKQILNAKKNLDIGDEIHHMPEPSFWVLLLCSLLAIRVYKRKSTRSGSANL
ncbi:MAG TPA: hypothetical protein VNZ86_07450, partial [Bacteroidia bacterium]|nr:hypothetical protein [Bacteroidia bacterium]